ncbi:MAG: hypothetical protein NZ730_06600 [Porticoccaceae bacterium]|nr:hypothetical protein [Porticoccaceae bacterium]
MKAFLNFSIDVTKVDWKRRITGKKEREDGSKGEYLPLTIFIDTEKESEYGDIGFIKQSTSQEEREAKIDLPYLGNIKIKVLGGSRQNVTEISEAKKTVDAFFEDDVPF